jgi:hypothetical protein
MPPSTKRPYDEFLQDGTVIGQGEYFQDLVFPNDRQCNAEVDFGLCLAPWQESQLSPGHGAYMNAADSSNRLQESLSPMLENQGTIPDYLVCFGMVCILLP